MEEGKEISKREKDREFSVRVEKQQAGWHSLQVTSGPQNNPS